MDTCIPAAQRQVHVASEAVALAVMAPFLAWLALQPKLPTWARALAGAGAVGTVVVDGWLLIQYARAPRPSG